MKLVAEVTSERGSNVRNVQSYHRGPNSQGLAPMERSSISMSSKLKLIPSPVKPTQDAFAHRTRKARRQHHRQKDLNIPFSRHPHRPLPSNESSPVARGRTTRQEREKTE